jgi:hypothetical protein
MSDETKQKYDQKEEWRRRRRDNGGMERQLSDDV